MYFTTAEKIQDYNNILYENKKVYHETLIINHL
jgi:hypothetical protein